MTMVLFQDPSSLDKGERGGVSSSPLRARMVGAGEGRMEKKKRVGKRSRGGENFLPLMHACVLVCEETRERRGG